MLFLDSRNHLEKIGDIRKSLFSCCLGKFGIHLLPLVLLTLCSDFKIILGAVYALKDLIPDLGVFLLICCCLFKDLGNLNVSVFPCLGSKISVLIARLGLAGERFHQIVKCLGPDQVLTHVCINICHITTSCFFWQITIYLVIFYHKQA